MSAPLARPARLEDAAAAVAVLRASITVCCVADHQNDPPTLEDWLRNKTVEHFARWLAADDLYLIVVERAAGISGVGSLHRSGQIRLCYVDPGAQGHGVGRALLTELEARAESWQLGELHLASSLAARTFYEHFGYERAGEPKPGFGVSICHPYRKVLGRIA
jgi:GNAT superfamily N-acetyltransferase